MVDRVCVVEVGDLRDRERLAGTLRGVCGLRERSRADVFVERVDELLRASRRDLLVVVSREEGATVDGVMLLEQLLDTDELVWRFLVRECEDVQPS